MSRLISPEELGILRQMVKDWREVLDQGFEPMVGKDALVRTIEMLLDQLDEGARVVEPLS